MNSEDHNSSQPGPTPNPDPALDPALEARVVAWVLGEASPFEAAELERIAGERPELAVLRRRLAAVHGLAAEAHRPDLEPMRLAPARRAKLLAALGAPAGAPSAPPRAAATAKGNASVRRRGWLDKWETWNRALLPVAAVLALAAIVGALLIPSVGKVRETARRTPAAAREEEIPVSFPLLEAPPESEVAEEQNLYFRAPAVAATAPAGGAASDRIGGDGSTSAIDAAVFAPSVVMAPPPPETLGQLAFPTSLGSGAARADDEFTQAKLAAVGREVRRRRELMPAVPASSAPAQYDRKLLLNEVAGAWQRPALTPAPDEGAHLTTGLVEADTAATRWNSPASPSAGMPILGDVPMLGAPFRGVSVVTGTAAPAQEWSEHDAVGAAPTDVALAYGYYGGASDAFAKRVADLPGSVPDASAFGAIGAKNIAFDTDAPLPRFAYKLTDETLRAEIATPAEPVSTFSLHVGDVSFRLAQQALAAGQLPDAAAIRPEEFTNAFDYGDPAPAAGEPVAARIEQAAHPFLQQRNLLRLAVRVPATGRAAAQPLRLTVLLDTSGSMEREDRAATVRAAFASLAALLGPADAVTLVGFARQPRLLAERVPGDQAGQLAALVGRTPAEGGTNLEEALRLAGELALRQRDPAAQNRIVLLTDGAANLGNAAPDALAAQVVALRQQGIAFDACGVGGDGLDDAVLEALTRRGDGRYAALTAPADADERFARQLAGALRPAAKDVKVQVRFNPARVKHHRLLGFEQHRLREEDFRNDAIDAAELAAGEAATALYQIEPDPAGEGELGELAVRFRDVATGQMVERTWTLTYDAQAPAWDRASPSLQLAGVATLLAEKLRGGDAAAAIRLDEFAPVLTRLRTTFPADDRVLTLVQMVEQARRLLPE